ncbi:MULTISPECIES: hypothetical protein [Xanthomonas translucens group]|jgi:hypothetical protein|uniref:Uncharacterized protein n=4 Tax=Xanthomonas graminis TaxID=3390026 RepID=A0A1M4IRJ9_9XANT|nr:hypothetical protein [Xanthomonas translucens]EKU24311.1 putative peptide [Xanthomonas translucens pv. graminis ART-Xtg29]MCS3361567.1 hypothetical protein [Xanthomonas translucens pv. translucens]MCS3375184.1 hypothetical protein [Xanthomonas translucens pv. translucens]MCT8276155.1 hypothetical protein [Xanthomonas translucens pv. translucens]MCT8279953.1 hypothetical protein [Xanthomonas translucens pv. translucens]
MTTQTPLDDLALRRKRAVRTALLIGAIAVLIYAGFILSGVLGR